MNLKDGGAAFPRPIGHNGLPHAEEHECSCEQEGMSLRDYFAAHAPAHFASWFQPKMPPRPEPQYDHDHPNEPRCQYAMDCVRVNDAEILAYDVESLRQFGLQWPYAYADAMLRERERRS